jgi:hypothetical protein
LGKKIDRTLQQSNKNPVKEQEWIIFIEKIDAFFQ